MKQVHKQQTNSSQQKDENGQQNHPYYLLIKDVYQPHQNIKQLNEHIPNPQQGLEDINQPQLVHDSYTEEKKQLIKHQIN
jgi:hypothetical protein